MKVKPFTDNKREYFNSLYLNNFNFAFMKVITLYAWRWRGFLNDAVNHVVI
jgi:hypothetical protein